MKFRSIFVFATLFFFTSCFDKDHFGATLGDCDDLCTAFNIAKDSLKEQYDLGNKNFPDQETGTYQVKETEEHSIR